MIELNRVLAVDLSLAATGLASWERGRPVVCETVNTKPPPNDFHGWGAARRHRTIMDRILRKLPHRPPVKDPAVVIVEDRIVGKVIGASSLDREQLRGVLEYALAARGVPIVRVNPMHLKKYATGKGVASKQEVMLAAERRLKTVAIIGDDNQADALWLLAMLFHHYGRPFTQVPVVQACVLDKVSWPRDYTLPRSPEERLF